MSARPTGEPRRAAAAAGRGERWRSAAVAAAVGLAVASSFTLIMATRNYLLWAGGANEQPWSWHVLREVPLWFPWLLFLPVLLQLSRRFAFRRGRVLASALFHAVAAPVLVSAIVVIATLGQYPLEKQLPRQPPQFPELLRRNVIALVPMVITNYIWIVALHHALERSREARQAAVEHSRLLSLLTDARLANLHNRVRLGDARLANLHNQLRPHFLFNALHGISSLMGRDVPGARRMLMRVSELLRLSLERNAGEEVTVEEELQLVERYLDLQKLRFEDQLAIRLAVDPRCGRALLPCFLVQTLVENAVRHGIEKVPGRGALDVEIAPAGNRLRVFVADNGPGFRSFREGGGGLANLRERLELLFGADHELDLRNARDGGAEVEIAIPLRLAPAPARPSGPEPPAPPAAQAGPGPEGR